MCVAATLSFRRHDGLSWLWFPRCLLLQVRALLENVEVKGGILDCCGSGTDAISTVMTAHGFRIATNDLNPMYVRCATRARRLA